MGSFERRVTLRVHEIALKGGNRPFFLSVLVNNLRRATRDLGVRRIWQSRMTVSMSLEPDAPWEPLRERLGQVFGVVKFALARSVEPSLERLEQAVTLVAQERPFRSFRITASRSDKQFPMTSPELNRQLGEVVRQRTGARVDLTHPELEIRVDVLPGEALVYTEEFPGPGGLPVGTGGTVACLMSGGIDSPVAAYRLMKRGCRAVLVHFHSFPLVEGRSREKARELAELLTRYQFHTRLYLVPFADLQKQVILTVPGPQRVVVYRRFMLRIAQAVARQEGALALVTGESLGQVGSQTLSNMATIDNAVEMPVLRPLVGSDKQEIIEQARALGTYPISILPDEDCCTLFVPPHPATRSTVEEVARLEAPLDVEGLVCDAVAGAEVVEFSC